MNFPTKNPPTEEKKKKRSIRLAKSMIEEIERYYNNYDENPIFEQNYRRYLEWNEQVVNARIAELERDMTQERVRRRIAECRAEREAARAEREAAARRRLEREAAARRQTALGLQGPHQPQAYQMMAPIQTNYWINPAWISADQFAYPQFAWIHQAPAEQFAYPPFPPSNAAPSAQILLHFLPNNAAPFDQFAYPPFPPSNPLASAQSIQNNAPTMANLMDNTFESILWQEQDVGADADVFNEDNRYPLLTPAPANFSPLPIQNFATISTINQPRMRGRLTNIEYENEAGTSSSGNIGGGGNNANCEQERAKK